MPAQSDFDKLDSEITSKWNKYRFHLKIREIEFGIESNDSYQFFFIIKVENRFLNHLIFIEVNISS